MRKIFLLTFLCVLAVFLNAEQGHDPDSLTSYYQALYSESLTDNGVGESSYLDSMLMYAEQMPANIVKAEACVTYAIAQLKRGDTQLSHKFYLKAIDIYEQHAGFEDRVLQCYFDMSVDYVSSMDTTGLDWVIGQMCRVHEEHPENSKCAYDYYTVLSANYAIKADLDSANVGLRDRSVEYGKRSLRYAEQVSDEVWKESRSTPIWSYFNIGLCYLQYWDNDYLDSVIHYAKQAEKVAYSDIMEDDYRDECLISIYDLQANVYARRKEYGRAIKKCQEVGRLLDEVELRSPNSVLAERGDMYLLLREIYEAKGDYKSALRYEKLYNQQSRKRYDAERTSELHELKMRYDMEKKNEEIERLEEGNRAARKFFIAMVVIVISLAGLLVAVIFVFRMRKRNAEQALYEAALMANNRQMEIELLYAMQKADKKHAKGTAVSEQEEKLSGMDSINVLRTMLLSMIERSNFEHKDTFYDSIEKFDFTELIHVVESAETRLSSTDKKYLLCFAANIDPEWIAAVFHVERASVYTVRYRIKRKLSMESE